MEDGDGVGGNQRQRRQQRLQVGVVVLVLHGGVDEGRQAPQAHEPARTPLAGGGQEQSHFQQPGVGPPAHLGVAAPGPRQSSPAVGQVALIGGKTGIVLRDVAKLNFQEIRQRTAEHHPTGKPEQRQSKAGRHEQQGATGGAQTPLSRLVVAAEKPVRQQEGKQDANGILDDHCQAQGQAARQP